MSIIYEALKKVEPQLENKRRPKPATRRKNHIIAAFIVIVLGAALSFTILFTAPTAATPQKPVLRPPTPKPQAKTPQPRQTFPPPSPREFALTGIFFSEGQGSALINNSIVSESDTIEGAKVVKITLNEVELEIAGQVTKLTLAK